MSDLLLPASNVRDLTPRERAEIPPPPAATVTLVRNLLASLDKHYPAHSGHWKITIDVDGGIVQIRNQLLSGKMGFVMHIVDIDPEGRKVVRMAGELLERYRVTRAKAVDLRDAIGNLRRAPSGEAVYDH